jgi:hypothetical protein
MMEKNPRYVTCVTHLYPRSSNEGKSSNINVLDAALHAGEACQASRKLQEVVA